MMFLVDAASKFYRDVTFTFFVDDVTIEVWGKKHNIHTRSAAATSFVIKHFEKELDMEVSTTKSVVISANLKLAVAHAQGGTRAVDGMSL